MSKEKQSSIIKKDFFRNYDLYLLMIPVILYYAIFCFKPMYGAIIAFKQFSPAKGIWGSDWVGFKYFTQFFQSVDFKNVMFNTINISLQSILFGFPAPILLALLLNELRSKKFAAAVKTISYFPHFISLVVICAMIRTFVGSNGLIGSFVNQLTGGTTSLLNNANYFVPIYIVSDIWQQVGWSSIIYVAAIAGIDQELYEAAEIDGASRFRQVLHIILPGISQTIIILFILRMGSILSVGYEKIILLYNPMIYETSDVISSYVYRKGLLDFNYSFSTAVGLFNSVINFAFVMMTNFISKKVSNVGII